MREMIRGTDSPPGGGMIREVIVRVGDVDAAVAFYRDVCGMTHVRTVEHEGAAVAEMDADGLRVTLAPAVTPGIALALHTDSVRSERRRLQRIDDGYDEEPVRIDGGSWLPLTDPWGNELGYWEDRETDSSQ
jgi:catechol 2,3-dioxygenase-like lactoylglutathione lyase family enzyme